MGFFGIHVKSLALNSSNISTEIIDGDEHIVIRGVVPVVDDVVMNGGLYPASEINKSYQSMEGKQVPYGHPKIDGQYISADTPRAVNQFHIGAWAENVRKDGDKVVMDVKVNRRFADSTDKGKEFLSRIDDVLAGNSSEPIHVSTGLLLQREQNKGKSKGKAYTWIARNMHFDHIAVLSVSEPGAATPEEGVGMFVNAAGEKIEVEQVNLSDASNCTEERLIDKARFFFTNASNFSFDDIYSALRTKLKATYTDDDWPYPETVWPDKFIYYRSGKTYRQKYLMNDDGTAELVGEPIEVVRKPTEYEEVKTNKEHNPMKDMIINALKAANQATDGKSDEELLTAYNALKEKEKQDKDKKEQEEKEKKEKATNSNDMPDWAKLMSNELKDLKSVLTANADKEKADKRAAVKAKFGLDDTAVNALDGAALDGFYAQCQSSTGLNSAFTNNNSESFTSMPE
ncbi:DUF2213 domain-containing protein [Xenorhabdus griffiniae]|uniref:DUF2213 domain-containing protein n=1 Tax=Xenorhabdus griffiniae TaxID=351672 RepID=A0ABY9XM74_9GAMM|nr:DUF2213 domain-containing protein [Xenorhabdus griffiniae]MBD1228325.1 DUF2213 domain-containing protein [Xenorhabdus griffiniae]MBE8587762.1 DUF2213 domain-containing protein [Xenorhabdus griffiniae]WMV74037.1 DUF2213 domain-containing protein [Xenorhabdus griffiniae]WNH03717.1 DUF2213 domain-containing protein [Xenorhabdus griffiniae]